MDEFCTECGKLLNTGDMYFDYDTNKRVYLCAHCWDEELFILEE